MTTRIAEAAQFHRLPGGKSGALAMSRALMTTIDTMLRDQSTTQKNRVLLQLAEEIGARLEELETDTH